MLSKIFNILKNFFNKDSPNPENEILPDIELDSLQKLEQMAQKEKARQK